MSIRDHHLKKSIRNVHYASIALFFTQSIIYLLKFNNMKALFTLIVLICISIAASAQTFQIQYDYDAAGNRISRTVITLNPINNKASEDSTYNEMQENTLADLQIKIYPNPTYGLIKVEIENLESDISGSLLVMDLAGRVLIQNDNIQPEMLVDFTPYAPGNYTMVLIIDGEKKEWGIVRQ
jgi:hypothetical protein